MYAARLGWRSLAAVLCAGSRNLRRTAVVTSFVASLESQNGSGVAEVVRTV
jgi:hypothetical protein